MSTGKGHARGLLPRTITPSLLGAGGTHWLLWKGVGQTGLRKPDATQVGTKDLHRMSRWTGKILMRGGSEGLGAAAGNYNWAVVISQQGLHWALHTAGGECACVPIIQDFYPSLKDMLQISGVWSPPRDSLTCGRHKCF